MRIMHILWSIIAGFFVGLVARALLPGAQHLGFFATVALGVVGSLVGGFIGGLISKPQEGSKFHSAGFLMSIVGALIVLYLWTRFM